MKKPITNSEWLSSMFSSAEPSAVERPNARKLAVERGTFNVVSGPCRTTNGGSCVVSSQWGSTLGYNDNERCTISTTNATALTYAFLRTEAGSDFLTMTYEAYG
eukprot:1930849-Prymnesium_polylepis.1